MVILMSSIDQSLDNDNLLPNRKKGNAGQMKKAEIYQIVMVLITGHKIYILKSFIDLLECVNFKNYIQETRDAFASNNFFFSVIAPPK